MSGSIPSLDRLVLALTAHPNQIVMLHTREGESALTFVALAARVETAQQLARTCGLGNNARVGLVAGNRLETLVIDFVALADQWTLVHLPEHGWQQTLLELPASLDALIIEPVMAKALRGDDWINVGELEGCRVLFRRTLRAAEAQDRLVGSPAVVFSSGTTGKSKAIIVDGDAVLFHAMRFFRALEASARDRFLIFLPLSNYQQKLLIYGSILSGSGFCLSDMVTVMAALKAYRPTLFLAPPVFYESAYSLSRVGASDGGECRTRLRAFYGGELRLAYSGMAPLAEAVLTAHANAGVPLYEAYGMTEFGPICANTSAASAAGSVGRPIAPGNVRIAEDGEIIASAPRRLTLGYLSKADRADQDMTYVEVSSIATGDIGDIDAEGFVRIRGRKKDIILTSQGYKVHPGTIERQFHDIESVRHAVVLGDRRPHLGLLIVTDESSDQLQQSVKDRVAELNSGPCAAHPIQRIRILTEPFSLANGLLTANMKLSRPRIVERYETELFR